MKEAIEDYIERCEKRARNLSEMEDKATDMLSKERLVAKKSVYQNVVRELKQLLEDENKT